MKVKSLFIVSKSGLFLKALDNYFKKVGLSIFTIDHATEALHFIKDLNPDIVLVTIGDFSDLEISAISDVARRLVKLVERESENSTFPELKLPINPENLIRKLEEIFHE